MKFQIFSALMLLLVLVVFAPKAYAQDTATLTLVKTVINDNGGLLTQTDFPSFVNGVPQAWDVATPHTANIVLTASETPQTGYAPSDWGGDCAADGTITLLPGDVKSCTITNDDVAPMLTLIKDPTNDDFGTALPDDFEPTVGGVVVISGESNVYEANLAYAIDETLLDGLLDGYSFVSIEGDDKCPAALGETITLDVGDEISCTIFNDDDSPRINLAKTVNGPAKLEADGTYAVDYTIVASNSGTGPGEYDLIDTISSGTGITLNIAILESYNAGTEDSQTGVVSGTMPFAYGNGVTLVAGEELAAGLNESWSVTANFTVNSATLDPATSSCDPATPVINTGFYNYVEGNIYEIDLTDNETCTGLEISIINLDKSGVLNIAATAPADELNTGDLINYTYLITASIAAVAGPITVADDMESVICPAVNTVGNNDDNLDPGESLTCTAKHTVVQADIDATSITNKATASGDAGATISNEKTLTVNYQSIFIDGFEDQ